MIIEFKIFENKEKVLYHGSTKNFDNFSYHNLGQDEHLLSYLGFHFTPDISLARQFAKSPDYMVYEVNVLTKKTLKIKEGDLVRDILKWGYENEYFKIKNLNSLIKLPYSTPYEKCIMDELIDHGVVSSHVSHKKLASGYKKYLIQQGYDSIEYLNEIEYDEWDEKNIEPKRYDWIVFSSNQIDIIHKYSVYNEMKFNH